MNPAARTCPACRQPLPADAPQGLCPQCLAKAALGSQPGAEETLASGSKPGGSGPAAIQTEIARLFPQLEILELLGQGGMGMVYKARQPQLDRLVALKIMRADLSRDPAFAERFAREARALAKLNHPNIVTIYDSGQTGGHCWFLMEFVDGLNLRQMMQAGRIQPTEALALVPAICDALQYAHDEGVTHRDIKPENILLDKKGRVKMADFGLAKLTGEAVTDFSITATGVTMGTPKYMAPEQIENAKSVDHRADIYSLGVVFYEMLTGELPLGRFDPPSARVQVDVRLDEIVLKALEKRPERRYQQASEVKTQVEDVAKSSPPIAAPPQVSVQKPSSTPPRLSRWALAGAILNGIAVLSFITVIFLGTVVFEHLFVTHYFAPNVPPLSVRIGEWIAGTIGFFAAIAGMVCGFAAIREIKRSGGKLCGLRLAAADALFLPLLAVGTLTLLSGHSVANWIYDSLSPPAGPGGGSPRAGIGAMYLVPFALAACFFAARFAWRKIAETQKALAPQSAEAKPLDHRVSDAVTFGLPGWFHRRAHWVQLAIEIPLLLVFILGMVSLLGFQATQSSQPASGTDIARTITSVRIGTPSPWLTADFGGLKSGVFFHWFASSMWIGLVGAAAAWLYELLRRSRPGFDVELDRRKQRKWWIVAAAVCALFLILLVAMLVRGGRTMEQSARNLAERTLGIMPRTGFEITKVPSNLPTTATPGRTDYAYKFNAPSNHALNVWLEFWKDGKLEIYPTFSESFTPARGDSVRATLHVTTQDGDMASVESAGKMRIDWVLGSETKTPTMRSSGTASTGAWRTNVFKGVDGLITSTWKDAGDWRPKPGEAVTLLALCGYAMKNGSLSSSDLVWSESSLRSGSPAAAMILRARFDPVDPATQNEGPVTKTGAIDVKTRGPFPGASNTSASNNAKPISNPYTFAGLPAPFVKGPDGPVLGEPFVKQMGFTPVQVVELNKTFQTYYREFLSLERRHTEFTRDAQNHFHVKITPFADESLTLAQKMATELRGLVGKEVIPTPQPGMLMTIGLFRHAGESSVHAEFWKEGKFYYFKEERIGAPNAGNVNVGVPAGRSTSGEKLNDVIPEEYRVYWTEK